MRRSWREPPSSRSLTRSSWREGNSSWPSEKSTCSSENSTSSFSSSTRISPTSRNGRASLSAAVSNSKTATASVYLQVRTSRLSDRYVYSWVMFIRRSIDLICVQQIFSIRSQFRPLPLWIRGEASTALTQVPPAALRWYPASEPSSVSAPSLTHVYSICVCFISHFTKTLTSMFVNMENTQNAPFYTFLNAR